MGWGMRIAMLAMAGLVSGCLGLEPGEDTVTAELGRVRAAGDFQALELSARAARIRARGVEVALAPANGLCIADDSFEASLRGAFLVVSDCVTEGAHGALGTEIELPPVFPGIVTVLVSGTPMHAADVSPDAAIAELQAFLATEAGLTMLGRNGEGAAAELIEAEPIGATLYVHVRDGHSGTLSLLADDFWRAFLEVEGRLMLVTVSGFRDRPLPPEEMQAALAAQVTAIERANGETPEATALALADPFHRRMGADEGPVLVAAAPAFSLSEPDPDRVPDGEEPRIPLRRPGRLAPAPVQFAFVRAEDAGDPPARDQSRQPDADAPATRLAGMVLPTARPTVLAPGGGGPRLVAPALADAPTAGPSAEPTVPPGPATPLAPDFAPTPAPRRS
ncbi:MAG: hypothetical protein ACFBSD_13720 [Paracoccaceae bacterium]